MNFNMVLDIGLSRNKNMANSRAIRASNKLVTPSLLSGPPNRPDLLSHNYLRQPTRFTNYYAIYIN